MYIKLPYKRRGVKLMYVHPQTTELLPYLGLKDGISAVEFLNSSIEESIKLYRMLFLDAHDELIGSLIEGFKSLSLKESITEDSILFAFNLSEVVKIFKLTNCYTFEELVIDSNTLVEADVKSNALKIIGLINNFTGRENNLNDKIVQAFTKRQSRLTYGYGDSLKLSVSLVKNLYINCHFSGADLGILSDFDTIKERLDIVSKCFVTRGLPLIEERWPFNVYIRDTFLLAPQSKKSLDQIGGMYGQEFKKVDIGEYKSKMKKLLSDDPVKFEEYAIQDSLITLKHVNEMTNFYFGLGKIGVPLTLSSISTRYAEKC
jgi:hypothetical protein